MAASLSKPEACASSRMKLTGELFKAGLQEKVSLTGLEYADLCSFILAGRELQPLGQPSLQTIRVRSGHLGAQQEASMDQIQFLTLDALD